MPATDRELHAAHAQLEDTLRQAGIIGPEDSVGRVSMALMPQSGLLPHVMDRVFRQLARQIHDYAGDFALEVTNPVLKCKRCGETLAYELTDEECEEYARRANISLEEARADRGLVIDDVAGVLSMIMTHECPRDEDVVADVLAPLIDAIKRDLGAESVTVTADGIDVKMPDEQRPETD